MAYQAAAGPHEAGGFFVFPNPVAYTSTMPNPYNRSPTQALAELPPDVRAAWRARYLTDAGQEARVMVIIQNYHKQTYENTIRTLWLDLTKGASGHPDVRAAAALAGLAMGLQMP